MRAEALKNRVGGVIFAKPLGAPYIGDDGTVVLDVADGDGNVYLGCAIVGQGGGADVFSYAPAAPVVGTEGATPVEGSGDVVLLLPGGNIPHPVVAGTLQSQLARGRFGKVDLPGDEAAFPDVNDVRDVAFENAGARVVLGRSGRLLLSTKASGKTLEVAAAPGSHIWLSLGEADTGSADRLLLATPTREALDDLVAKVNELEALVVLLYNTLAVASQAAAAAPPPVDPAFKGFATAVQTAITQKTASPLSATSDTLEASAVLISPTSKAQE